MLRYLWISVLVLLLDQATKLAALKYLVRQSEIAILPFLNFTLVYNSGAAFGFLSSASGWQNTFFITIAIIASLVIFLLLRRLQPQEKLMALGLALIFGGALGNLLDRLLYGYVVDFIDVYYRGWHWPAFNVADSAITIGAVMLIADALLTRGNIKPR